MTDQDPAPARTAAATGPLPVARYSVTDPRWTCPPISIALLSDLHVCSPWTPLSHIARIVDQTNALMPDLVLLGGDYLADRNTRLIARPEPAEAIAACLTGLRAPLGIFAILGNHDWVDCDLAQSTDCARNSVIEAFAAAGLPLLRNAARHVPHGPTGFWVVGTDSQRARKLYPPKRYVSHLDAEAAFAEVPPGAPAIHLAHEPDYFASADPRAFLQISGHTHGGQIKVFGRTPVVPSAFGSRYVAGYIQENGNHLIVSRGIGTSGPPLRIGVPAEIVLISLGGGLKEEST